MSYLTHHTLLTNNLKMTPQGYHRLSGSSRWPTPVWKLSILSIVTTHTCKGVLTTTTTQKITFALYKLLKIIPLNTTTLSMAKIRTGMKKYMTKLIYNFETRITHQLMTRMTQTLRTIYCLGPSLIYGSHILRQRYRK